jgi:hypothetical protein
LLRISHIEPALIATSGSATVSRVKSKD